MVTILFFQMAPTSKKNLALVLSYYPVKCQSIGRSVFELESRNQNVDGQTDVGHTNLIGELVTVNPPKTATLELEGMYRFDSVMLYSCIKY